MKEELPISDPIKTLSILIAMSGMVSVVCLLLILCHQQGMTADEFLQANIKKSSYVNPLIGTTFYLNQNDNHDYGNTMPSVGQPNAHTTWSAQTQHNENKCKSSYYHFDKNFMGMRRTHWMSGSCVIDYGSASILPAVDLDLNKALTFHALDHSKETAAADSYTIELSESQLSLKATSLYTSGMLRIEDTSSTSVNTNSATDFFYILIMAHDNMYNQSSVTISDSDDTVYVTNPVHRWYQSTGEYAGFDGHHIFTTSRPALEVGIIHGYTGGVESSLHSAQSDANGSAVAYLKFARSDGPVTIKTACSFISRDKALDNLQKEFAYNGITSFDDMKSITRTAWERKLSLIDIPSSTNTATGDELVTFYTAFWHSLILPRQIQDVDGEYLSFGDIRTLQKTNSGQSYFDDFSMWDIYRAQFPLFSILQLESESTMGKYNNQKQSLMLELVSSLVNKCKQGGFMPIFPAWNSYTDEMIGDHANVLIALAVYSGALKVTNALLPRALQCLIQNALTVSNTTDYNMGKGRRALQSYLDYGYIPIEDLVLHSAHIQQQVSRTLEYAFDDYVLSQLLLHYAASLPEGDKNTAKYQETAAVLLNHSENYHHVIDSTIGFVRAKHQDGTFAIPNEAFDPSVYYKWLTETNVWQYNWAVPHQVEKMIELFGGDAMFTSKLDSFFDDDWYNHGNEPDHHVAYLYAYSTSKAYMTQRRVMNIMLSYYNNQSSSTGGDAFLKMPGNEDAGQMSSWYVLSAMGLYQVCPGCGGLNEFVIGVPYFDDMTIRPQMTKTSPLHITVTGRVNRAQYVYIQNLWIDEHHYDCGFASLETVQAGGHWHFELGLQPNKTRAAMGRICLTGIAMRRK